MVGDQELDNVSVGDKHLQRYQVSNPMLVRSVIIYFDNNIIIELKFDNFIFLFLKQQESLDNPNRLSAGEIINCENTQNGKGQSNGETPLVITIGLYLCPLLLCFI